jgi:uncharacterized membrane protein required for colicin V production
MVWVDIILTIIFIFSFIAGLREGVVKGFLSLVGIIIAIPVTAYFYHLLTDALSFIPDYNWQHFLGFFGTFTIATIILAIIFFIPARFIEGIWGKGVLFTLLGGVFSVIGFAIFLTLFTIVTNQYPIFYWLEQVLNNSSIIDWLMTFSGFIHFLLSTDFEGALDTVWQHIRFIRAV